MKFKTIVLLFLSITLIYSCEKDESTNGGVDDFVGKYICREECSTNGNSTYSVEIKNTSTTASEEVQIINFYNLGTNKSIMGQIDGFNINIPYQNYSNTFISGNGTLNGTTITLSFGVDDGNTNDSCSAVLTRQ